MQFFLLGEVRDDAKQHLVEVAGGLAGLDQIDGRGIKHRRERGHRLGKRGAFAEMLPHERAQEMESGLLDTHAEESHCFAGREPTGRKINERLEEWQSFAAGERSSIQL